MCGFFSSRRLLLGTSASPCAAYQRASRGYEGTLSRRDEARRRRIVPLQAANSRMGTFGAIRGSPRAALKRQFRWAYCTRGPGRGSHSLASRPSGREILQLCRIHRRVRNQYKMLSACWLLKRNWSLIYVRNIWGAYILVTAVASDEEGCVYRDTRIMSLGSRIIQYSKYT